MKKVIVTILIILGLIIGFFIGTNETRVYDGTRDFVEQNSGGDYPIQALYGCPKSKKVKKPILKRKYIKLF